MVTDSDSDRSVGPTEFEDSRRVGLKLPRGTGLSSVSALEGHERLRGLARCLQGHFDRFDWRRVAPKADYVARAKIAIGCGRIGCQRLTCSGDLDRDVVGLKTGLAGKAHRQRLHGGAEWKLGDHVAQGSPGADRQPDYDGVSCDPWLVRHQRGAYCEAAKESIRWTPECPNATLVLTSTGRKEQR
jgi:hypothetical protein